MNLKKIVVLWGIAHKKICFCCFFCFHLVKTLFCQKFQSYHVSPVPTGASRRSRWSRNWGILQANWSYQSRQFFETSTLHGVRYIAEKRTPLHERLLWFVFTVGGLMAALVIIDSLWDKFQTSPTITGLDSDYHSWDVPFPALTMCQRNPANETLIAELVDQCVVMRNCF